MAKLKPCKACGNMIAKDAKVCPSCGAKNKRGGGCGVVIVAVIIIVAIVAAMSGGKSNASSAPNAPAAANREDAKKIIEQRLEYLKTVPEFAGFVVLEKNSVYITLKKAQLFDGYGPVCNAAAANASQELVSRKEVYNVCTVYLLPPDGKPEDKGKVIYTAYASDGQVKTCGDEPYGEKMKMQAMTPEQRKAFLLDKKAQENAAVFEKKHVSSWDGSVKPVVRFVKSQMNNPDSFKHVSTNWWYVKGTTDRYRVKMTFRGTNTLGGVVTNTVDLIVDQDGNVLKK